MSSKLGIGLHFDIAAKDYHADPCEAPSLSSGIARTILSKSLAHAYAEHPRLGGTANKDETDAMDRGSLVHAMLAGTGASEISVGEFSSFRSKAAQEWAQAVRSGGKIPALLSDMMEARKIADAVRAKATAGITENPFLTGLPEVTAIWERNGAFYRARYDRLQFGTIEPWTAWDWKVTSDISVQAVKRKVRQFGYHYQAAHYIKGMDALCPKFAGRHSFVFVFVEDAPPHSVRRYCLKADTLGVAAIDIGRAHAAWEYAIRMNAWPDASRTETTHIDVPTFSDDDEESDQINAAA